MLSIESSNCLVLSRLMPGSITVYLILRQLIFSLVMALLGTMAMTPLLMVRYRQRVSVWMMTRSDTAAPLYDPAASAAAANGSALAAAPNLWQCAEASIRARSWAYAAGGASQALLLSLLFTMRYRALLSLPTILGSLAVFLLPTLFSLAQLRIVSGWRKLLLVPAALLVGFLLSGGMARVLLVIFNLHIILPALVLLVFNLRFWRGAAPLVFLLAISGFSGWMLTFALGQGLFGMSEGVGLVLLRLIGFAGGLQVGLFLLRRIAALHAQGKLSDQELLLDTWWLIYTIIQTVIFAFGSDSLLVGLLVLLSFGLYWGVKRQCLARLPVPALSPRRLLLLRVFGNSRRSERLFEQLRQAWNPIGSIELIAGSDLALQQVGPLDFLAFLTGRLGDRFAGSAVTAAQRMSELPQRLADHSYPAYQSLCLANTWHSVMRILTHHSDAVVMDLREFGKERQGCRLELETLSQELLNQPVVLVTDASTDLPLLHALLAELGNPLQSSRRWLANGHGHWSRGPHHPVSSRYN